MLDVVQDFRLIQKNVLEELQGVGGTFNENKTSELLNLKDLKLKKRK